MSSMNPDEPIKQWRETVGRLEIAQQRRALTKGEQRLLAAARRRVAKAEARGWDVDSSSEATVTYDPSVGHAIPGEVTQAYGAPQAGGGNGVPKVARFVRGGLPGLGKRR